MNNDKVEGESGWKVLNGDDDNKNETPAGATAVGGHRRNAVGQAGSSAASDGRPAAADRVGWVARAPSRWTAPRLANSWRLDVAATLTSLAEVGAQGNLRSPLPLRPNGQVA